SKISEVRVLDLKMRIIKVMSINVKHAQKEMKYINTLCLSALITKKNMHLAQKN
ncbi:hypothetical protein BDDG_13714, partial [Blastomyces dermatitidis ATCC 18188]